MTAQQPPNMLARINREIQTRAPYLRDMLPKEITPERLRTFVITAMATNDALQQCSLPSLLGAVYASAKVGIEPDGVCACVVPRKGKAQFQLMYRGAVMLAQRSGLVRNVWAEVVHANDEFDWQLGSEPKIRHRPASGDRGDLLYAYACARFRDGFVQFRVIDRDEIARARGASQAKDGPWHHHEAEMWRKTAVHRLCKQLPLPSAVQQALDLDEAAAQGREQAIDAEWSALPADEESAPANGSRVRVSQVDAPAREPGDDAFDAEGPV